MHHMNVMMVLRYYTGNHPSVLLLSVVGLLQVYQLLGTATEGGRARKNGRLHLLEPICFILNPIHKSKQTLKRDEFNVIQLK